MSFCIAFFDLLGVIKLNYLGTEYNNHLKLFRIIKNYHKNSNLLILLIIQLFLAIISIFFYLLSETKCIFKVSEFNRLKKVKYKK